MALKCSCSLKSSHCKNHHYTVRVWVFLLYLFLVFSIFLFFIWTHKARKRCGISSLDNFRDGFLTKKHILPILGYIGLPLSLFLYVSHFLLTYPYCSFFLQIVLFVFKALFFNNLCWTLWFSVGFDSTLRVGDPTQNWNCLGHNCVLKHTKKYQTILPSIISQWLLLVTSLYGNAFICLINKCGDT